MRNDYSKTTFMKKHYLLVLAVIILSLTATHANAQWAVGIKDGWTRTSADRTNLGRIDESYSPMSGYDIGIQAHYSFVDWMAIRVDVDYMRRSHRMDRNLPFASEVFTEYRNDYLMLPVMADFSFGGNSLRGHLLCGGYGGYWLKTNVKGKSMSTSIIDNFIVDFDEEREFTSEDQRFTAGLVGGVGLSLESAVNIGVNIDALYYYDLVSYNKGYAHMSDPRYLSTFSLSLGVYYKF